MLFLTIGVMGNVPLGPLIPNLVPSPPATVRMATSPFRKEPSPICFALCAVPFSKSFLGMGIMCGGVILPRTGCGVFKRASLTRSFIRQKSIEAVWLISFFFSEGVISFHHLKIWACPASKAFAARVDENGFIGKSASGGDFFQQGKKVFHA